MATGTAISFNISPEELPLLHQGLRLLPPSGRAQALRERLEIFAENLEWPLHDQNAQNAQSQSPQDLTLDQVLGIRERCEEEVSGPRKLRRLIVKPPNAPPHNPSPPSCPKRNGAPLRGWESSSSAMTSNATAESMISSLAVAHLNSGHDVSQWTGSISSAIRDANISSGNSLASAVRRCQGLAEQGVGISFLSMLAYIQVSIQCQTFTKGKEPRTLGQLYEAEIAKLPNCPSRVAFYRWNGFGRKFAGIAAGGLVYTLMIIAGLDLRWHVSSLLGRVPWELGKMLRQPDTSKTPGLIRDRIIPLIAHLRQALPLSLHQLFPPEFTEVLGTQHSTSLDATDLIVSDMFFGAIKQSDFHLPDRDLLSWQRCSNLAQGHRVSAVAFELEELPAPEKELEVFSSANAGSTPRHPDVGMEVFVVETAFDTSAPQNKKGSGSDEPSANMKWTEKERRKAEAGYTVKDVRELSQKLGEFYIEGCKQEDQYLRIPNVVWANSALDIRNEDGTLMAFLCAGVPDYIRSCLLDNLASCFDGKDVLKHRARFGRGVKDVREPFQCIHLSWWNRYSTLGRDAPQDTHPHNLTSAEGSRVNYSQMLPYTSVDMSKHERLYQNLTEAYGELFAWIEETFKKYLPEEYEILVELVDLLPGQPGSPVRPFSSWVVNVNVCTEGHRDTHDKNLCLVIALGEFEGGELVMYEQGLVIEMRNGDFQIFRSLEMTHFNLDFEGKRASFVLHTDANMDRWKANKNMWEDNRYFNSLTKA